VRATSMLSRFSIGTLSRVKPDLGGYFKGATHRLSRVGVSVSERLNQVSVQAAADDDASERGEDLPGAGAHPSCDGGGCPFWVRIVEDQSR
jgi:hypothetical protein